MEDLISSDAPSNLRAVEDQARLAVYHQALVMEQGAFFEGQIARADNPMADLLEPELPMRNEMTT
jgi:hypothetical protein